MHPLAFFQKRAHLCAVARGREMFAHVEDMTPARFDVLYAIYMGAHSLSTVREWLGLARQTIWKMVERLVELGLVLKDMGHRRSCITIWFTPEGWRRFRQAMDAAFNERWPLPKDATKDATKDGDVPRHWRRPELSDDPAIRATVRNRPHVRPRDGGPPIVKKAAPSSAASAAAAIAAIATGLDGPPAGASLEELQQYYDSLYDGTYVRPPQKKAAPALPVKRGREVARIYARFVAKRCPVRSTQDRRLSFLHDIIELTEGVAEALGNTVRPLYTLRIMEEFE